MCVMCVCIVLRPPSCVGCGGVLQHMLLCQGVRVGASTRYVRVCVAG